MGTGRTLEPLGQIASCPILLGCLFFEENGIAKGTSWKGTSGSWFMAHLLYRSVGSKGENWLPGYSELWLLPWQHVSAS